jgi:hypothetical protein
LYALAKEESTMHASVHEHDTMHMHLRPGSEDD